MQPWMVLTALAVLAGSLTRSRAKAITRPRTRPQEPKSRIKPPKKVKPGPKQKRVFPIKGKKLPTRGKGGYLFQRTPTHKHRGIDIVVPKGTPVYSAAAGIVEHASNVWRAGFTGYGRHVVIKHGDRGPYSLYAHLDRAIVSPGQKVLAGQQIGTVGKTLFSRRDHTDNLRTGPHLHFEVAKYPYPMRSEAPRLDPVKWLLA